MLSARLRMIGWRVLALYMTETNKLMDIGRMVLDVNTFEQIFIILNN